MTWQILSFGHSHLLRAVNTALTEVLTISWCFHCSLFGPKWWSAQCLLWFLFRWLLTTKTKMDLIPLIPVKGWSTTSARLSAYTTDYRHADKHLRLVMTLIALCCTRQSSPLTLTLIHDLDPDIWPWPQPLTLTLKQGNDLDLQSQPSQGQGKPTYQISRS